MGSCDNNKICLANLENNDSKFICDDYTNENKLYNYQAITFINDENNSNDKSSNDKSSNDNTLNDNLTKITDMIKNNQDIIYNNYVLIIIIFIIIITFIIYYMYK